MVSEKETDWNALSKTCDDIAAANGFDRPDWNNFPIKAMLVITEITEVLEEAEAYVSGVHDGIARTQRHVAEEFADIAIRLLSMLYAMDPSWNVLCALYDDEFVSPYRSLGDNTAVIQRYVSGAVEWWRKDDRVSATSFLADAFLATLDVSEAYGVNLAKEVRAKNAKNRKRPKLHGKKRQEG